MVLALSYSRANLFFRIITTVKTEESVTRDHESVLSRTKEIPIPIIQSMKTNMEPISSQIMTNKRWPDWITEVGRGTQPETCDRGNSVGVYCRVKTWNYSTLSRPVIWFKWNIYTGSNLSVWWKSANYIQLIVVWILVSMIMNQIMAKITNNTRGFFVRAFFQGTKRLFIISTIL